MLTVQKSGRYWTVLGPGEQMRGYSKTKRQSLERLSEFEKQDAHEARLLAMDAAGVWTFTGTEQAEIGQLAEALRTQVTRRTLSGIQTIEAISRKEQVSDVHTIDQWHALGPVSGHGKLVCAELRFLMAARRLAFEQAGLVL